MDDVNRILPSGWTIQEAAVFAVLFILSAYRLGLVRSLILFAVIFFIRNEGFKPYTASGGGVAGAKVWAVTRRYSAAKTEPISLWSHSMRLRLGSRQQQRHCLLKSRVTSTVARVTTCRRAKPLPLWSW